jgi:hypothetical protein
VCVYVCVCVFVPDNFNRYDDHKADAPVGLVNTPMTTSSDVETVLRVWDKQLQRDGHHRGSRCHSKCANEMSCRDSQFGASSPRAVEADWLVEVLVPPRPVCHANVCEWNAQRGQCGG